MQLNNLHKLHLKSDIVYLVLLRILWLNGWWKIYLHFTYFIKPPQQILTYKDGFFSYQCVRYDLLLRHVNSRQLVHLIE